MEAKLHVKELENDLREALIGTKYEFFTINFFNIIIL